MIVEFNGSYLSYSTVVVPGTDVCTERGTTGLARRVQKKKKKDYTTPLDL